MDDDGNSNVNVKPTRFISVLILCANQAEVTFINKKQHDKMFSLPNDILSWYEGG